MIKVSVNIPKAPFDMLAKDLKTSLTDAVKKAMLFAEGKSKGRFNTPGNLHVITGTLRRSITAVVEDMANKVRGSIFTNVFYGPPHELGLTMRTRSGSTYQMPLRPFLRPAIEENLDTIKDIIIDNLIKELA